MLPSHADPHAPPAGAHPHAGWFPNATRPPAPPGAGDDGLINLAGIVLATLAVLLLATVAAAVAVVAYGVVTWRRTRWWPPVLAGIVVGVVAVAVLGGAGPALHHHLLAAREVTAPHNPGFADLLAGRWAAWAVAQLPLSLGVGLVAAGFARHRVTHLPAHDLSPGAQARRRAEDDAQLRRAQKRAAAAPLRVRDAGVLGAWAGGDAAAWRAGEWCTVPAQTLGLGTILLGLPGTGKTETLLRLAQLALADGWDVHVIDAKGDPHTQARFAALAVTHGHTPRLFPAEPYDGWRGDGVALRNRFSQIVDFSEPYYQDGTRVLLAAATASPLGSMDQLIERLELNPDVDATVRRGAVSRYRSFATAAAAHLSGRWAFEDAHASYTLLDGVALGDDTPRLARFLTEDFLHFAAVRKPPDRRALLLVDEFSALQLSNASAMLERLRSFGVGVVLSAQSVEGLHHEPSERARLLNTASTIVAHRLADPEEVCARAGTVQRAERSHQLDPVGATGMGSLRIQETYRIDPNQMRGLPVGVAWVVSAGHAAKVAVARTRTEPSPPPGAPRPVPDDDSALSWLPAPRPIVNPPEVSGEPAEDHTVVDPALSPAPSPTSPLPALRLEPGVGQAPPAFDQQTLPLCGTLTVPGPPAPAGEPADAPQDDDVDAGTAPSASVSEIGPDGSGNGRRRRPVGPYGRLV